MPERPLVGTVLTLPGATAAELLAEPFDFVWVDLEHGALGRHEAQEMILGSQAAGALALVRLPAADHELAASMLDAGADGVVLANLESEEQATQAAARLAHPPLGTRGRGPRRLALRGRTRGQTPQRAALWVQIESAAAIEQASAVAAVRGIDAVVVGTADLSHALGVPLDLEAPALLAGVEVVRSACRAAGTTFGLAGALDHLPAHALKDTEVLVHSTDARLCAKAVDAAADWLRAIENRS